MDDYKPNSHKSKEEQNAALSERKNLDKIVSGNVKIKKKSDIHKFADIFLSEDAANVKNYILMDVLVPAVKKAISDIITNGIDMILYGGNGRKPGSIVDKVSYRDYSSTSRGDDRPARTRSGYSYADVILDTRGEVEEVLNRMDELIDTYGVVSVADLYDLVGITCNYTDNKYGWTNIRNAEPIRVRNGYMLKLPKAMPIE